MMANASRRRFLAAGAAGLTFTLGLRGASSANAPDAAAIPLNVWIAIRPDGTIAIVSPAAEVGQGSFTSLPLIVAEELDADWSKVTIVQPPWNDKADYGNPYYGTTFQTTSSMSIRAYFTPLRIAGAQARRVLLDAVAAAWSVPVSELTTQPSTVVHHASGRRISYGAIAAFASVPAQLPVIAAADLKPTSQFRLIGHDVPRVEMPLKVTGAAKYAMDVHVPGMIHAAVLQTPYVGGAPATIDDARARAIPGVIDVVMLPAGVAVLGTTVEGTLKAKNLLAVTWTDAPAASYDTERALDEFATIARDLDRTGVPYQKAGDVATAMKSAAKVMQSDYRTRHTYHAQMEPLNATASVAADGKSAEIWCGTQSATTLIDEVAALLATAPEKITVHQHWVGGAYGRRTQHDVIVDAVRLARIAGKPVKLIWSREDDLRYGKFRPATAHHIEAGFDADGKIVAWHHRVVSESYLNFISNGKTGTTAVDRVVMKGTAMPSYGIPHKLAENVIEVRGARLSSYRGVGNGYNTFAAEGFVDEIARSQGTDPLAFRLDLLKGNPRAVSVVKTAAEMAGWGRPRPGRALGIVYSEKDDTPAAAVAEVSVDRASGKITVHNMWATIDPGIAVQPKNIVAQTEGAMVFALGHVLREKIDIKNGRVQQSNFSDYQVTRMAEIPEIAVRVISTDNPPTGASEDGVPLMAASIGNAVYALTGVRLRELPFSTAYVRSMLATSPTSAT